MPARNDDVDFADASVVIVDRSIDGSDDASVVTVILVTTVAVDATVFVFVEFVRHVEVEPFDAAVVRGSRNRGKEG
jgi:hypothetical protein